MFCQTPAFLKREEWLAAPNFGPDGNPGILILEFLYLAHPSCSLNKLLNLGINSDILFSDKLSVSYIVVKADRKQMGS